MSDEPQDIFGKIDALFEKRAGFGVDQHRGGGEDFPLLTDVVGGPAGPPGFAERRRGERRSGTDRRQAGRRSDDTLPHPTLDEAQFHRFIALFEQKLEDLFIRQQLRMEESIRRAVREEWERLGGDGG
jgi:hypothetical protein